MEKHFSWDFGMQWHLYDDRIVKDKAVYKLDNVTDIRIVQEPTELKSGNFKVFFPYSDILLIWPKDLIQDGYEAYEYIYEHAKKNKGNNTLYGVENDSRAILKDPYIIEQEIRELKNVGALFIRKEILELPYILKSDEHIKALTSGIVDANTWLILCTDKRIIFLDKGILNTTTNMIELRLTRVNSITHTTGVTFGKIIITDNAMVYKVDKVPSYSTESFANAVREQIELIENKDNQSSFSNINNSNISIADELLKLKTLVDQGILSQEEFDIQKKKLLSL